MGLSLVEVWLGFGRNVGFKWIAARDFRRSRKELGGFETSRKELGVEFGSLDV